MSLFIVEILRKEGADDRIDSAKGTQGASFGRGQFLESFKPGTDETRTGRDSAELQDSRRVRDKSSLTGKKTDNRTRMMRAARRQVDLSSRDGPTSFDAKAGS